LARARLAAKPVAAADAAVGSPAAVVDFGSEPLDELPVVAARLASPLSSRAVRRLWEVGGGSGERWSHSPSDSSYRLRVIHYRDNRVVGKVAEVYVD
jgi:hypothetical protein